MKRTFIIIFGIILFISNSSKVISNPIPVKRSLSGKITDKKTGDSLPGVSIYFPDIKTGAISNEQGYYHIDNLPQSKVLLQVSFVSYKLIKQVVDLSVVSVRDFALEESVKELDEIVVTGVSKAEEKKRAPTPITTIPYFQMLQNSPANIIDALAKEPGVSQITTGSGISKPVIRGLGYNRVVTVNDGIRQEGQQWGDEHGIEIDEFSIRRVEILKGPASLSYGSDAMAGVINLLSAPTLPDGHRAATVLTTYQSNNGLIGYSANFAGNQKGFIWEVRATNKLAHSYQNKYDGYVANSGFRESAFGGIAGVNKYWGYSHLHFNIYNLIPGIIEGERDSLTGEFVKPIALSNSIGSVTNVTDADFKSYTPLTPYQKVHHYKAVVDNNFILGDGSLKTTIGWQQNQRQEYGNILNKNHYGLYFLLNTFNYDVRYIFPEKNYLNLSVGVNGMKQISQNKGTEFLVPEYDLFDFGLFFIAKKSLGKLDISGGLRYDSREEYGKDLFLNSNGAMVSSISGNLPIHKFTAFTTSFTGISGSIGATYQFNDNVFTKTNISRGFRAPNIGEIGANGVHDGTSRYEIGDPGLKAENSLQFDYALGLNSEHVTAEIDLFRNTIHNFIFPRKLESVVKGDSLSNGYSTFKFVAGEANLSGGEISVDIHPHPLDWLHFENSFSLVRSTRKNQPDSTKYLPFTPAPKLTTELKASTRKLGKHLVNAYLKIGVENYFLQDQFFAASRTETATPGYVLLNLGMGTEVIYKNKSRFSIFISVDNLTDKAYQSHLSRLKYLPVNYLTGRTGVYNMGRNFSLKLIFPII